MRDFFTYLLDLTQQHGDLVRFKLGPQSFYLVTRPEDLDTIFVGERSEAIVGETWAPLLEAAGRRNLLGSTGADWKQERRFTQPHFSGPVVAAERRAFTELIRRTLVMWAESPTPIALLPAAKRLMLELTARKLFGAVTTDAELATLYSAASEIDGLWNVPLQLLMNGRGGSQATAHCATLHSRLAVIDPIVRTWIERCALDPLAGGFLSHYVRARPEDSERDRLHDVAVSFLLTGFDTTASAFYWTIEQLLEHPAALATLHDEYVAAPADDALIPDFPWTLACVSEAIRLFPPVWYLARVALIEIHLRDYAVPAGTIALASPYVIHRQPQLWTDADTFRPERFMPWGAQPVPAKAYLPFGLGARTCIGKHLALAEVCLAVGTLFRHYTVRRTDTGARTLTDDFTLRARSPIHIALTANARR